MKTRQELRERGLRNPRHTFATMHSSHLIYPLFVAPLRPMETLVGLRMRVRSMLNRMVVIPTTPPIEVEYCVWRVPVRAAGDFFVDMFVNDPNDIGSLEPGQFGLPEIAPLPIAQQGSRSRTPLQTRDRLWAGESGQADGEVGLAPTTAYAPYVSHAIWHIARSWYTVEATETTLGDSSEIGQLPQASAVDSFDLYQNPPKVGRLVKSALSSALGAGGNSDQVPASGSLADWAMRLSVLDNANRSWTDYLRDQGVDPRRIDGMPEPVLMQRRLLQPWGTPQCVFTPVATGASAPTGAGQNRRNAWYVGGENAISAGGTNTYVQGNFAGYCQYGTTMDETRGKRLLVEEPSLLIGTLLFRPYDFDQRSGAHVFDAVYMINGGTWGDAVGGAMDERDFIISRTIDRAAEQAVGGTTGSTTLFQNDFGQASPHVVNMLNLYMNGDTYSNAPTELGHFRRPLSDYIEGSNDAYGTIPYDLADPVNLRLNSYGDVRFGVATDMVS